MNYLERLIEEREENRKTKAMRAAQGLEPTGDPFARYRDQLQRVEESRDFHRSIIALNN